MRLTVRGVNVMWSALCGSFLAAVVWSCSQANAPALSGLGQIGANCTSPATGCECAAEGQTVSCGDVLSRSSESVTCLVGTRTCSNGKWSTCAGKTTIKGASIGMKDDLRLTDLQAQPAQCVGDPCDPACTSYVDNGSGFDAGSGLTITDAGGVTLTPVDASVCSGTATTNVTGTVYDPAGTNPIYNAFVYVPSAPVLAFTAGVSADKCGGGGTLTGNPVALSVTGPDGKFTLTGVPAGANVPLVIQVGRWRRQVTIPTVNACTTNPLPAALTRLPRNQTEGDIPYFAIATGGCDYLECLMKRIGIDSSEFTAPSQNGRVAYYQGSGGLPLGSSAVPFYDQLVGTAAALDKYDVVMLPCQCAYEYNGEPFGYPSTSSLSKSIVHTNLRNYTSAGGRLFTSHWGREWIEHGPNPTFPGVANWDGTLYGSSDPISSHVDVSTLRGQAFAQWLTSVGVSNPFPTTPSKFDVSSVIAPTTGWLYAFSDNNAAHGIANADNIPDMSFNTPLGTAQQNQVGRVVFADTHVSADAVVTTNPRQFPDYCATSPLSAQEKALEFLFFDLAACVTPVNQPVLPLFPNPAVFVRDYQGICPATQGPVWEEFGWASTTPLDSNITFSAQTADTEANLAMAPTAFLAMASGPPQPPYTLKYVDPELAKIPSKSNQWLRITITLNPSTDHAYAPTLNSWEQLYDCTDNQ